MVNPTMDYKFFVALTNNSNRLVTGLRGVVSLRSYQGSDLLVNHPFALSALHGPNKVRPCCAEGAHRIEHCVPVSTSVRSDGG